MRRVFIDTNILIFATSSTSPFNVDARNMLKQFLLNGDELVINTQVLREYMCNMTEYQFDTRDAIERNVERFQQMTVVSDGMNIFQRWLQLVQQFRVSGKAVYDCNIVATMIENGVTEILTYNVKDFARYHSLVTVLPFSSSISTSL